MNKLSKKLTLGIELIDDDGWMGGTLYLRNLAICMSRLPDEERPNLRLVGSQNAVKKVLNNCPDLHGFESPINKSFFQRILQWVGLKQKKCHIDVIYPGFGQGPDGAKVVRWIPDFQHRYLPELFSEEEIAARDRSIAEIAAQPGVVVLSSKTAAEDFRRFFSKKRVTPRVWQFCSLLDTSSSPKIDPRSTYGLPDKYLYLPNQFWEHKNHIVVLQALSRLRREHGLKIPLVCTGAQSDRRNLEHFSNLMAFISNNNLSDQVHLLGLIDREDQITVFRFAAAVVQPSLFEGWSTVVEDTRSIGRPIFLSDIPVHREQAPNRCSYFLPNSDKDLASLILNEWEKLQPGPDPVSEKKARRETDARILRSARVFSQIINDAVAL